MAGFFTIRTATRLISVELHGSDRDLDSAAEKAAKAVAEWLPAHDNGRSVHFGEWTEAKETGRETAGSLAFWKLILDAGEVAEHAATQGWDRPWWCLAQATIEPLGPDECTGEM
jgi:hypothetical protein